MKRYLILILLSITTSILANPTTLFNNGKNLEFESFINTKEITNHTGSLLNEFTIPPFFTPNGDGMNDTWVVTGDLDIEKIFIFDRYGKLLKQILPGNFSGWDGTHAGKSLPTSQYWYYIEYTDGSKETGSFTLKR